MKATQVRHQGDRMGFCNYKKLHLFSVSLHVLTGNEKFHSGSVSNAVLDHGELRVGNLSS